MAKQNVTVVHEEATPRAVTMEIDIVDRFTVADLRRGFNARLNERVDPLHPEDPHDWTPDQKRFMKAWNDRVGWGGMNRLPQVIIWQEDAAERGKLSAGLAAGDVQVVTAESRHHDEFLDRLETLDPALAQKALNILAAKAAGKDAMEVLGDTKVRTGSTGARKTSETLASEKEQQEMRDLANQVGRMATVSTRRGEAASGELIGDVNSAGVQIVPGAASQDGGATQVKGRAGQDVDEARGKSRDDARDARDAARDAANESDDVPVRDRSSRARPTSGRSGRGKGATATVRGRSKR